MCWFFLHFFFFVQAFLSLYGTLILDSRIIFVVIDHTKKHINFVDSFCRFWSSHMEFRFLKPSSTNDFVNRPINQTNEIHIHKHNQFVFLNSVEIYFNWFLKTLRPNWSWFGSIQMEIVDIFDIHWDWKYWRFRAYNSIAVQNGDWCFCFCLAKFKFTLAINPSKRCIFFTNSDTFTVFILKSPNASISLKWRISMISMISNLQKIISNLNSSEKFVDLSDLWTNVTKKIPPESIDHWWQTKEKVKTYVHFCLHCRHLTTVIVG